MEKTLFGFLLLFGLWGWEEEWWDGVGEDGDGDGDDYKRGRGLRIKTLIITLIFYY